MRFLSWLLATIAPGAMLRTVPEVVAVKPLPDLWSPPVGISDTALAIITGETGERVHPFVLPEAAPWLKKVNPTLAMDRATTISDVYQWATAGAFHEGVQFLGYAYLAELSQRPEYRHVSGIWAAEATRKWIKINGTDEDRVNAIEAQLKAFGIAAKFRELAEHDGFFGRAQLFVDMGHDPTDARLASPLHIAKATIAKGSIKNFKVIEPFWSYPGAYDSTNPLSQDFYRPRYWQVMSSHVDASRILTFVGRAMPDMLKPAYGFGGLALSQMIKPYVDNWLRTRQSVSDLIHSFSTMVLSTDMSQVLAGGAADTLLKRLIMFTRTRDNRGVMAVNKDTEELTNVQTSLSSLDKLQSQAQEQIASVSGIPLVILLGVTPSGLNASSDGEIRSFYATIKAYQERIFRGPLETIMQLVQLNMDGKIDEDITFEFIDLFEMDEAELSKIRKSDADMDVAYVAAGIVSNEEVRERIVNDESSPYFGVDLSAEAPDRPDDAAALAALKAGGGNGPDDGSDDDDPPGGAQDAGRKFDETKIKRGKDGKFGSGGGGVDDAPFSAPRPGG